MQLILIGDRAVDSNVKLLESPLVVSRTIKSQFASNLNINKLHIITNYLSYSQEDRKAVEISVESYTAAMANK